jgi:hypothetical protein
MFKSASDWYRSAYMKNTRRTSTFRAKTLLYVPHKDHSLETLKFSLYFLGTRLKTIRLLQCWWKQDWTTSCCPHCSKLSTILHNIVTPDSGSTILSNTVDKCEQRGQQNVQSSPCIFEVVASLSIRGKDCSRLCLKVAINKKSAMHFIS